jgi:S1-C subfamily serine protease
VKVGDQYRLEDRGSTNGTMINGRRIIVSELHNDDLIEFGAGGPLLRFEIESGASDTEHPGKPAESEAQKGFHSRLTGLLTGRAASSSNGLLIAAILASMLVGAVGGVLIARRPTREPGLMTPAEISAANRDSVVFIRTDFDLLDASGQPASTESCTGTGFFVTSDGLIVTNRHVVRDWEYNPLTRGMNGRVKRISVVRSGQQSTDATEASLYRLSPGTELDIAVLKIDVEPASAVRLGEAPAGVDPGSNVVVLGYPLGADLLAQTRDSVFEPSLATGTVSRIGQDYIQLNLNAYRGNSGGPVFTTRGMVIGILTGKVVDTNIAICTPIGAVLPLINK